MSAHELYFGTNPNLRHLRVFGSITYVHVPKEKRRKLDAKAEKCNLVGYSDEQKGHKCYNPRTKQARVSCDIVFDESTSWYLHPTPNPDSRALVWCAGYNIYNPSARSNSRPRYTSWLSRPASSASPSAHAHMQCYQRLSTVVNSASFRNTAHAPTLSLRCGSRCRPRCEPPRPNRTWPGSFLPAFPVPLPQSTDSSFRPRRFAPAYTCN